jgi:hypothetical protein
VQVERIVEKPVDRIVDKVVQPECPKPQTTVKHGENGRQTPNASSSAPNSPPIGSVTQGPGSAFSNNQQGGVTAGQYFGNPPAEITIIPVGDANRPGYYHQKGLFFSDFQVSVVTKSPIPTLVITAQHPALVGMGCYGNGAPSRDARTGNWFCAIKNASGNERISVTTSSSVISSSVAFTWKCDPEDTCKKD